MYIGGAYRQPTFLYESSWNVVGFIILMLIRHRHHLFKQGEVFLTYLMWYSFGRFFVEGMRTDSLYITASLRVSQLLSVILFVGALAVWVYRRYRSSAPWYLEGNLNAAINNKE
jgi:phosphatidylglycerol:prolipoprotein diacylglycerol transferase